MIDEFVLSIKKRKSSEWNGCDQIEQEFFLQVSNGNFLKSYILFFYLNKEPKDDIKNKSYNEEDVQVILK